MSDGPTREARDLCLRTARKMGKLAELLNFTESEPFTFDDVLDAAIVKLSPVSRKEGQTATNRETAVLIAHVRNRDLASDVEDALNAKDAAVRTDLELAVAEIKGWRVLTDVGIVAQRNAPNDAVRASNASPTLAKMIGGWRMNDTPHSNTPTLGQVADCLRASLIQLSEFYPETAKRLLVMMEPTPCPTPISPSTGQKSDSQPIQTTRQEIDHPSPSSSSQSTRLTRKLATWDRPPPPPNAGEYRSGDAPSAGSGDTSGGPSMAVPGLTSASTVSPYGPTYGPTEVAPVSPPTKSDDPCPLVPAWCEKGVIASQPDIVWFTLDEVGFTLLDGHDRFRVANTINAGLAALRAQRNYWMKQSRSVASENADLRERCDRQMATITELQQLKR